MSDESKIDTLAGLLRDQIKKGVFGTKGRLPTIAQIGRDHQLGRTAVYQALERLQAEGLILARDNAYFANYPIMRVSGAPLFDKFLNGQGLTSVTENIVEPEIIPIPAEIADLLGQKEAVHVVHRVRRHGTADIPYRLAENWYPVDLAGDYVDAMRENPDLNVAGEIRKNKGVAIATRHDDLIARLPTPEEAKLLRIVRNAPVMDVKRKFLAQDGRVIFVSCQVLVGAFFQLGYDAPHHRSNNS